MKDAPRMQSAHDRVFENWLRDVAGPACDALKADPGRAIPLAQVRARLREKSRKADAGLLSDL